ncbi:putative proteasome subunit alpha type-7 [Batrachochytrium dendrobatidis]|nr:putative proteasome subunit alpha type-7 [Batrachochytrium dendrobatidis]
MVGAGLLADSRHLVTRARQEAANYKDNYKSPIPSKMIADRVAQYVSAFTLYSSVRPFGIATIIASMDTHGPALYMIEPSGVFYGYNGCAVGKGKQVAKTEIEKLKFTELTAREAVKEAARIIHFVHDEAKDKSFELELTWICDESKGMHQVVPAELAAEAVRLAKAALADEMDED